MSYLRYLCLFAYIGVQHILCCVFDLFVFALCTLCCWFIRIIHFSLLLRYSLTLIKFFKQRRLQILIEQLKQPSCTERLSVNLLESFFSSRYCKFFFSHWSDLSQIIIKYMSWLMCCHHTYVTGAITEREKYFLQLKFIIPK